MNSKLKASQHSTNRAVALVLVITLIAVASTRMRADTGTCNGASITLPFTDVPASNIFFCAIASAYFTGLTNGTTPTTYNPTATVNREQMAAFITRTLDQSLRRGGNRAALNQWWTQATIPTSAMTQVGNTPRSVQSDGSDLWVASGSTVSRVQASDGRLLETWTGASGANAVLVARGRIFVTANASPGRLYSIDPTQPPGAATLVSAGLGEGPRGIAYDGSRIWTSNSLLGGSVSIVSFAPICGGVCVVTVSEGFTDPEGILYDGSDIWVTDQGDGTIKKLNSEGSIVLSLPVGNEPGQPIFDGTNIWVPNSDSDSVTVVRVKDSMGSPLASPFVLATLTGNGLRTPQQAAFDGQHILVTNFDGNSASLWRATHLTPLGSFSTGANSGPRGACSDGINFWITLVTTDRLARF
jgi:hypothetical protein